MSKPITDPNEIQRVLEQLINEEEKRSVELKSKIEDLKKQLADKQVSTTSLTPVQFGTNVNLQVGSGKSRAKVISSNATYEDFCAFVKTPLGTDENNIGFRDDSGRSVYLRTNQDIQDMFKYYFAEELSQIQIVTIPKADLEPFSKFDFRKEYLPKSDETAVFRCEAVGTDGPLCFIAVDPKQSQKDGFNYFRSIFGTSFSSLMFVDEAEDIITIDSNESWEYCIDTGVAMSKIGRYQLLLIQFSG